MKQSLTARGLIQALGYALGAIVICIWSPYVGVTTFLSTVITRSIAAVLLCLAIVGAVSEIAIWIWDLILEFLSEPRKPVEENKDHADRFASH